jgi:hypothetical protein
MHFAPGTYVITGSSVFTGNTSLETDPGTTFYLTCSRRCAQATNKAGGSLTWSETTADFRITGPADGMSAAIVVDPHNTAPQLMVDTSALPATSRDMFFVNGGIDAPTANLTVRARNHLVSGQPAADTLATLDVTGKITVGTLTVTGIGALLSQHGTPPSGPSMGQVPIRLVQ